ncbi:hypothetical protein M501DRAFT_936713 [Patellaria atrata CBS 101060]|uniref:BHLH domain-containing protein n=1 Tax=Patellaria atrata CBS 101060 TaxID=1346257 RepID=A0A9P4SA04_9PEZI|nr:hypothetical protein M501DRAFT_936713 [Patellaria atrata CBS 101060]
MNQPDQLAWSQSEQFETMAAAPPDHDFTNFLDLDIDLDFPIFDQQNTEPSQESQQVNELSKSLDMQHLPSDEASRQPLENNIDPQLHQLQPSAGVQNARSSFYDFGVQPQYAQQQQQQQQQQPVQPSFSIPQEHTFQFHRGVPPTPNSMEMRGDIHRYIANMDPQTRAILEQRYQLRQDDMAFTPLVSPAVTPHEAQFRIAPEYTTVPGAYFSPLTSPALEAQNHAPRQYHPHPHTASSPAAASPIDLNVNMAGDAASSPVEPTRKLRSKRSTAARGTAPSSRVRQSPITKPQRRKATLSSVLPPKEVSDLLDEAQRTRSAGLGVPHRHDSSEAESISPEPLSESLMGPPPRPGSVTQSPSITAMNNSGPSTDAQNMAPATPASLMRLQKSPSAASTNIPTMVSCDPLAHPTFSEPQPMMEDLTLPEAATTGPLSSRPSIARLDTAVHITNPEDTPRLTSRKTPKLDISSTPSGPIAASAKASPSLSAITSPSGSTTARKTEKVGGRGTAKKRGSTTASILVSPALRPKISPSIKPLLPEGTAISPEAHALLLASKSNYQNILDGTHVPGVSYPEALSTNLTSKRTSHKIAEQGRRNRINMALQEMQSLLPKESSPKIVARDDIAASGSNGNSGAAEKGNSKAATVESAIVYIRLLQKEAGEREKEVEELRRRLGEMEKALGKPKGGNGAAAREGKGDRQVEAVTGDVAGGIQKSAVESENNSAKRSAVDDT